MRSDEARRLEDALLALALDCPVLAEPALKLAGGMPQQPCGDGLLPPLQGEGRGGDGWTPQRSFETHPHPVLPLEGEGTY